MCHVCLTLLQSASDFCVSPDTYITRVTKENAVIDQGMQTGKYRLSDLVAAMYIFPGDDLDCPPLQKDNTFYNI